MSVKWRVTYEVMGKTMACEYGDPQEADVHRRDIAGYEGVTNCKVTHIDDGTPALPGLFEVKPPQTRYDVLGD